MDILTRVVSVDSCEQKPEWSVFKKIKGRKEVVRQVQTIPVLLR